MNLKNNKGYAAEDILISVIVLLLFVPTIFGISYNIKKANNEVKRKTEAINIASSILEEVKTKKYEEISLQENQTIITGLSSVYITSTYNNPEYSETGYNYNYYTKIGTDEEHYIVQIGAKKYGEQDVLKIVKVRVIYPVGKDTKAVDMSMAVQKY